MARQVQIIKGTTEQNDAFTGAEGALTYDTETKNLRIHDGTTEGGFEIPSSAMTDYVIYWDSADATDHSHAKPGVSTPTDHGWYRYYKSGWVEQGGCLLNAATGAHTITIPIEMASVEEIKKSAITTPIFISGTIQAQGVSVRNSDDASWTTTQIDCFSWGATIHIKWQVSGMAA